MIRRRLLGAIDPRSINGPIAHGFCQKTDLLIWFIGTHDYWKTFFYVKKVNDYDNSYGLTWDNCLYLCYLENPNGQLDNRWKFYKFDSKGHEIYNSWIALSSLTENVVGIFCFDNILYIQIYNSSPSDNYSYNTFKIYNLGNLSQSTSFNDLGTPSAPIVNGMTTNSGQISIWSKNRNRHYGNFEIPELIMRGDNFDMIIKFGIQNTASNKFNWPRTLYLSDYIYDPLLYKNLGVFNDYGYNGSLGIYIYDKQTLVKPNISIEENEFIHLSGVFLRKYNGYVFKYLYIFSSASGTDERKIRFRIIPLTLDNELIISNTLEFVTNETDSSYYVYSILYINDDELIFHTLSSSLDKKLTEIKAEFLPSTSISSLKINFTLTKRKDLKNIYSFYPSSPIGQIKPLYDLLDLDVSQMSGIRILRAADQKYILQTSHDQKLLEWDSLMTYSDYLNEKTGNNVLLLANMSHSMILLVIDNDLYSLMWTEDRQKMALIKYIYGKFLYVIKEWNVGDPVSVTLNGSQSSLKVGEYILYFLLYLMVVDPTGYLHFYLNGENYEIYLVRYKYKDTNSSNYVSGIEYYKTMNTSYSYVLGFGPNPFVQCEKTLELMDNSNYLFIHDKNGCNKSTSRQFQYYNSRISSRSTCDTPDQIIYTSGINFGAGIYSANILSSYSWNYTKLFSCSNSLWITGLHMFDSTHGYACITNNSEENNTLYEINGSSSILKFVMKDLVNAKFPNEITDTKTNWKPTAKCADDTIRIYECYNTTRPYSFCITVNGNETEITKVPTLIGDKVYGLMQIWINPNNVTQEIDKTKYSAQFLDDIGIPTSWQTYSINGNKLTFSGKDTSGSNCNNIFLRIRFKTHLDTLRTFKINATYDAETNYDYVVIGKLDTLYSGNYSSVRSSSYYQTMITSSGLYEITMPAGDHFVDICYTKDGSQYKGEDSVILQFTNLFAKAYLLPKESL